jgi:hypothetical protein
MLRTVVATIVAGLLLTAHSGTAQAAVPVAPLASGLAANHSGVTQVRWVRRCWRGRWGRLHCRTVWW